MRSQQQPPPCLGPTSSNLGIGFNIREYYQMVINLLMGVITNPAMNYRALKPLLPPSRRSMSTSSSVIDRIIRSGISISSDSPVAPSSAKRPVILNQDDSEQWIHWTTLDPEYLDILEHIRDDEEITPALSCRQNELVADGFEMWLLRRPVKETFLDMIRPRMVELTRAIDTSRDTFGISIINIPAGTEQSSEMVFPYYVSPKEYIVQYGIDPVDKSKRLRLLQPVLFHLDDPHIMRPLNLRDVFSGMYDKWEPSPTMRFAIGWYVTRQPMYHVHGGQWPHDDGRANSPISGLLEGWCRKKLNEFEYLLATHYNANRPLSIERTLTPGRSLLGGGRRRGEEDSIVNQYGQMVEPSSIQPPPFLFGAGGGGGGLLHGSSMPPPVPSGGIAAPGPSAASGSTVAPVSMPASTTAPTHARRMHNATVVRQIQVLLEMQRNLATAQARPLDIDDETISPEFIIDIFNNPTMMMQRFNWSPTDLQYIRSAFTANGELKQNNNVRRNPCIAKDTLALNANLHTVQLGADSEPSHYEFHARGWVELVSRHLNIPRILREGNSQNSRVSQEVVIRDYQRRLASEAHEYSNVLHKAFFKALCHVPRYILESVCQNDDEMMASGNGSLLDRDIPGNSGASRKRKREWNTIAMLPPDSVHDKSVGGTSGFGTTSMTAKGGGGDKALLSGPSIAAPPHQGQNGYRDERVKWPVVSGGTTLGNGTTINASHRRRRQKHPEERFEVDAAKRVRDPYETSDEDKEDEEDYDEEKKYVEESVLLPSPSTTVPAASRPAAAVAVVGPVDPGAPVPIGNGGGKRKRGATGTAAAAAATATGATTQQAPMASNPFFSLVARPRVPTADGGYGGGTATGIGTSVGSGSTMGGEGNDAYGSNFLAALGSAPSGPATPDMIQMTNDIMKQSAYLQSELAAHDTMTDFSDVTVRLRFSHRLDEQNKMDAMVYTQQANMRRLGMFDITSDAAAQGVITSTPGASTPGGGAPMPALVPDNSAITPPGSTAATSSSSATATKPKPSAAASAPAAAAAGATTNPQVEVLLIEMIRDMHKQVQQLQQSQHSSASSSSDEDERRRERKRKRKHNSRASRPRKTSQT